MGAGRDFQISTEPIGRPYIVKSEPARLGPGLSVWADGRTVSDEISPR